MKLLDKIRKLNGVLCDGSPEGFSFNALCELIGEMTASNVYIMDAKGEYLGGKFTKGEEFPSKEDGKGGLLPLDKSSNESLLAIKESRINIVGEETQEIYGKKYKNTDKYHIIVPIIFSNVRIATLETARKMTPYKDEDVAIIEYGATVIGMKVSRDLAAKRESEERSIADVTLALETLSYSELEAVGNIFKELDGNEGVLVASKIADNAGITRSVIVNALRKLESAGVIGTRSLGMKGTRIKIVNHNLLSAIKQIEL